METVKSCFTVYFEEPFWIGVYERTTDNKLEVCKITFGAEPKDCEVYDFLLKNYNNLQFSNPIKTEEKQKAIITNPKRLKRKVEKQLNCKGIGTKSQQALQLQREANKIINKQKTKQQFEEEQQKKFEIRQQKKKDKHKGR